MATYVDKISALEANIQTQEENFSNLKAALADAEKKLKEEEQRKSDHQAKSENLELLFKSEKKKIATLEFEYQAHKNHLKALSEIQKRGGLIKALLSSNLKQRGIDNAYLATHDLQRGKLIRAIPNLEKNITDTKQNISDSKKSADSAQDAFDKMDDISVIEQEIIDRKNEVTASKDQISDAENNLNTSKRALKQIEDELSIEEAHDAKIAKRQKGMHIIRNIGIGVASGLAVGLVVTTMLTPVGWAGALGAAGLTGSGASLTKNAIKIMGKDDAGKFSFKGTHDSWSDYFRETIGIKSLTRAGIAGITSIATLGTIQYDEEIGEAFGLAKDNVVPIFEDFAERASPFIENVKDTIAPAIDGYNNHVTPVFKSAFEGTKDFFIGSDAVASTTPVTEVNLNFTDMKTMTFLGDTQTPELTLPSATSTPPTGLASFSEVNAAGEAVCPDVIINGETGTSGMRPDQVQTVRENFTDIALNTPPTCDVADGSVLAGEASSGAVSPLPDLTSNDYVNLNSLLDSSGGTDAQAIESIIEAADKYGADAGLSDFLQEKLDAGFDFIDSASSAEIVGTYNAQMASALADGGVITADEYKEVLNETMREFGDTSFVTNGMDTYLPKGTRAALISAAP